MTTGKLANDAVTNAKLADDAVQTENIVDLNVTTGKLAADAVTNAKLADDAVQTENITDLHVTRGKIAADAIDNSKLADDAVQIENIAVNTIRAGSITHSTSIPSPLSANVPFYSVHLTTGGMVTVPSGAFEGQVINITATSGLTINWGARAEGIGLAGSARIASGIWRSTGWYFSETVV